MRLTALCICGTLLAFLNLSWTTADAGEGVLLGDKGFGPCTATLRPAVPCRHGQDESTCPYLFNLPPLTVHLPKQLRELEKIIKDLQKLKDNVDQLREMCADCKVSQSERECGREGEREYEMLIEGKHEHKDERSWMNERNPERLQENDRDLKRECGMDRVKVEKTMKGDSDSDLEKRTTLEDKRKKWEAERESDKGPTKENEKEKILKEMAEKDGKTQAEGAKGEDKMRKIPAAGGNERAEVREKVVNRNNKEPDRDQEKGGKGNSRGDQEDDLDKGKEGRKITTNVKSKQKTEESNHHIWQDETKETHKKTQTEEDRGRDRIKMSGDHDGHTNREQEQHREERKKEMEKGIKEEQNNEKPKQTESIGHTEKEKTIKEGEVEEDREKRKEIKTEEEKTVQSVQRDSDGELASSKAIKNTDFVSITPTPRSIISLTQRPDSMDSDEAITIASSLPSPPLTSSTSRFIADFNEETTITAYRLPSSNTDLRTAGIAEHHDARSAFRTSRPAATATKIPGGGASSQNGVSSTTATSTTINPHQNLDTTIFSGAADRSHWSSKKNISSNIKTGVKPLLDREPKPSEKHKRVKPVADQKQKNPKSDHKQDQAPLSDRKTKHDQKHKPSPQKPTADQTSKPGKNSKRVQISKLDQRPDLPTDPPSKHGQDRTNDQNLEKNQIPKRVQDSTTDLENDQKPKRDQDRTTDQNLENDQKPKRDQDRTTDQTLENNPESIHSQDRTTDQNLENDQNPKRDQDRTTDQNLENNPESIHSQDRTTDQNLENDQKPKRDQDRTTDQNLENNPESIHSQDRTTDQNLENDQKPKRDQDRTTDQNLENNPESIHSQDRTTDQNQENNQMTDQSQLQIQKQNGHQKLNPPVQRPPSDQRPANVNTTSSDKEPESDEIPIYNQNSKPEKKPFHPFKTNKTESSKKISKINQKHKLGQPPNLPQKPPKLVTGQRTKPNVKPKPNQTPQTNNGLKVPQSAQTPNLNPKSVSDQIPGIESNKTSKRWPPPRHRPPTTPTLQPGATPAKRPKQVVQPKPSPKTKTHVDLPQISRTTTDSIQNSHIDKLPTSRPIKHMAEVSHSPGETEFSPSTMKISLDPKTSHSLEAGSFPRLHTLPEGFTISPNSRIMSDLRPQTASQPSPIPTTTRPNKVIHGILPSVMPRASPGSTKPNPAKILHNVEEKAPSKLKIPVPSPSAQPISSVSSDFRSTTLATSGPEAPLVESSTSSARELRVKINQVAAFPSNNLNPNGRPSDMHPEEHLEYNRGGSKPQTFIPSEVTMARRDCSDLLLLGETKSGVYLVTPDLHGRRFRVFCDMERDGGGWTVLQRRQDGSVSFNRTWAEYRKGFGELNGGEFWLGNDIIHLLTRDRDMMLFVELEDFDGVKGYARYDHFRVASERLRYKLTVGGYSGTAGDSLRYGKGYDHNNKWFTTPDRDHDLYPSGNCGAYYSSGWWFDACMAANLNGRFYVGSYKGIRDGIYWGTWHNISTEYYPTNDRQSFKNVRMMIRPKGFTP